MVLVNPVTGWLFRFTGLDPYSAFCRLTGKGRGRDLRRLSRRRTGRDLPNPPDLERSIETARGLLAGGMG